MNQNSKLEFYQNLEQGYAKDGMAKQSLGYPIRHSKLAGDMLIYFQLMENIFTRAVYRTYLLCIMHHSLQ
jgi:hypothetical protein